jgi:endonuclease YncB( thermonuclease family)
MRRDIWLASLAGVIVGSWVTLIAVQVEEHGFGLPNRANITIEAESHPAVTAPALAPTETAKATAIPATTAAVTEQTTPAATTAPSTAAPGTIDNGNQSPTTTPSVAATASASPPAIAPTSTPEDTAKALLATSADQIDKGKAAAAVPPPTQAESKTSTELAQPKTTPANPGETQSAQATPAKTNTTQAPTAEVKKTKPDKAAPKPGISKPAPSNQTKTGQTPAGQGPADQADRELAASAHRTAPTEPPSEQASLGSDQKPSEQAKPVELVRPFSDRAGILTIAGRSVQLHGIIPTDVDRMCTGPNGKSWPCGAAARTAFRMYLRGRTIDCDLPSPTWQGTVTGACRYVRVDLSEWLVRFGWAEPEAGSPLVALAEQAKQQKRGIYGDDPRSGGKSTLGPALPKEDPLNPI